MQPRNQVTGGADGGFSGALKSALSSVSAAQNDANRLQTEVQMENPKVSLEDYHHIQVKAEGKTLDWLNQNLVTGSEPHEILIPIAYNDPVGEYEISALNQLNGASAKCAFKIK